MFKMTLHWQENKQTEQTCFPKLGPGTTREVLWRDPGVPRKRLAFQWPIIQATVGKMDYGLLFSFSWFAFHPACGSQLETEKRKYCQQESTVLQKINQQTITQRQKAWHMQWQTLKWRTGKFSGHKRLQSAKKCTGKIQNILGTVLVSLCTYSIQAI